jgi:Cdc6-like AAA superfamily ATPase
LGVVLLRDTQVDEDATRLAIRRMADELGDEDARRCLQMVERSITGADRLWLASLR